MDQGLIVFLILFALGLLGLFYRRKIANEAKSIGAEFHSIDNHIYGISGLSEKEIVKLFFTDESLITKAKGKTYELKYNQLTAIQATNQTDLLKKDRSVIGRGVAGGLLLGPLGAIVGGMSAVGRHKKVKGEFLILNYISSGEEEPKVIIFDMKKRSLAKKAEQFVLNKSPNLIEPDHVVL